MSTTKPVIRDMLEIAQDEFIMRDRIMDILKDGAKNVNEISDILGYPSQEVMVWLFGLRRYGFVEENERADVDGYFKYEIVEKEPEQAE